MQLVDLTPHPEFSDFNSGTWYTMFKHCPNANENKYTIVPIVMIANA